MLFTLALSIWSAALAVFLLASFSWHLFLASRFFAADDLPGSANYVT